MFQKAQARLVKREIYCKLLGELWQKLRQISILNHLCKKQRNDGIQESFRCSKWKRIIGWTTLVVVLCLGGYLFYNFGAVYSDGYRDGTLLKFSRKGYVFKTWEGELNQGGVTNPIPGTAMVNQIWNFSVSDDAVAEKLNQLPAGKVIKVHYRQYNKSLFWRGETTYFVDGVEEK